MKIRAEDLLGDGWETQEDGVVHSPKSLLFLMGYAKSLHVKKGDKQVLPYDAETIQFISHRAVTDPCKLLVKKESRGSLTNPVCSISIQH